MEIPKRKHQRWDGDYKLLTKDCFNCEFYREIDKKELCGWGVAFKYLCKTEKPRKCEVKNRGIGEYVIHSVEYLDKFPLFIIKSIE